MIEILKKRIGKFEWIIVLVVNLLRLLLFDKRLLYLNLNPLFLLLFNNIFRVSSTVMSILSLFWRIPQPLLKVRPSFPIFFNDESGRGGIHMKFSSSLRKTLPLIDNQSNKGFSFLHLKGLTFVEIWAYLRFCREYEFLEVIWKLL